MTLADPFAPEEAQTVVPAPESPVAAPAPPAIATAYVDVKPNLVGFEGIGDSEQVRLTMKSGSAYDVPWITVDFPSIDVAHERLTDVARQVKLAEIFDIAGRANAKFIKSVAESKPVTAPVPAGGGSTAVAAPAAASPSAPPPGATGAPSGETRQCQHGEMQFRSGVGKSNGKVWQAFMCPTPKGTPGQCEAEWLR